jgi:hypothetical protein
MIRGILKDYDFPGVIKAYSDFVAHVANTDDPHEEGISLDTVSLFQEIANDVFTIYQSMLPSPLSLNDFNSNIVPTLNYPELIRRICLNHTLYNAIKNEDGSVNSSVSVTLSDEYGWAASNAGPVTITFVNPITDETDFIRAGWNGGSSPYPVIFTAENLIQCIPDLRVVFSTSSCCPLYDPTSVGGVFTTDVSAGREATIVLEVVNTPTVQTTLLELISGIDTLSVIMNTDKTITVVCDGITLTSSNMLCSDGKILVSILDNGQILMSTSNNGTFVTQFHTWHFIMKTRWTKVSSLPTFEDPTTPISFGLRSATVYDGAVDFSQLRYFLG